MGEDVYIFNIITGTDWLPSWPVWITTSPSASLTGNDSNDRQAAW